MRKVFNVRVLFIAAFSSSLVWLIFVIFNQPNTSVGKPVFYENTFQPVGRSECLPLIQEYEPNVAARENTTSEISFVLHGVVQSNAQQTQTCDPTTVRVTIEAVDYFATPYIEEIQLKQDDFKKISKSLAAKSTTGDYEVKIKVEWLQTTAATQVRESSSFVSVRNPLGLPPIAQTVSGLMASFLGIILGGLTLKDRLQKKPSGDSQTKLPGETSARAPAQVEETHTIAQKIQAVQELNPALEEALDIIKISAAKVFLSSSDDVQADYQIWVKKTYEKIQHLQAVSRKHGLLLSSELQKDLRELVKQLFETIELRLRADSAGKSRSREVVETCNRKIDANFLELDTKVSKVKALLEHEVRNKSVKVPV